MKKTSGLLLISLCLMSCYTFNKQLLVPSGSESGVSLLPLEIGSTAITITDKRIDTATVNSDFMTVFTREMETNVFSRDTKTYGTIEVVIAFEDWRYSILGNVLSFFSGISLYSLNILGLPENQVIYDLQIDIIIRRQDGQRVRKYSFSKTSETIVGPFYYNGGAMRRREIRLELFRECIEDFKGILRSDARDINNELVI